jgi:hypothetical protein
MIGGMDSHHPDQHHATNTSAVASNRTKRLEQTTMNDNSDRSLELMPDQDMDANPIRLLQRRHSKPVESFRTYLQPEAQPKWSCAIKGANPWTGQTADEVREAAFSKWQYDQMTKARLSHAKWPSPPLGLSLTCTFLTLSILLVSSTHVLIPKLEAPTKHRLYLYIHTNDPSIALYCILALLLLYAVGGGCHRETTSLMDYSHCMK